MWPSAYISRPFFHKKEASTTISNDVRMRHGGSGVFHYFSEGKRPFNPCGGIFLLNLNDYQELCALFEMLFLQNTAVQCTDFKIS